MRFFFLLAIYKTRKRNIKPFTEALRRIFQKLFIIWLAAAGIDQLCIWQNPFAQAARLPEYIQRFSPGATGKEKEHGHRWFAVP